MADLKDQAEALLRDVDQAEARKGSERLTPGDRALILRLAAKGNLSQEGIAKAVGCSQPTVSRVLALVDTRKEARTILESGAAKMAQTVVDTDDAGIALKALGKLDVVRDDKEGGGREVGPIVMFGSFGPPRDGLQPGDRITVCYLPLGGGSVQIERVTGPGHGQYYDLPADFSPHRLPEGVTIDPDAVEMLRAQHGQAIDVPLNAVTPQRVVEAERTTIMIGMPTPGTPRNPLPIGHGSTNDAA